jgi:hypothetical protein
MNQTGCSYEDAVAAAVRTGQWNESLTTHVRGCAVCRGVQESSRWMQALAQGSQPQTDLPGPQVIWLRAQFLQRQAAAERTHKLTQWVEIACITVATAGVSAWLAWNWDSFGDSVGSGFAWAWDAWANASASVYSAADSPLLVSSIAAGISWLVLALAYPLLARE